MKTQAMSTRRISRDSYLEQRISNLLPPAMHNLLGNLLQEIERQRSLCEDSCTIAKPNATAKEGLGSPDLTYGQALSDLKNDLVGTEYPNSVPAIVTELPA